MNPSALDAPEAKAVLRELRRLRDEPPPKNPSSAGCAFAFAAIVALLVVIVFGGSMGLSPMLRIWLGVGLGRATVAGGLLSVFGGGFVRGAISADVEAAIARLTAEAPGGDRGVIREATVRILDGSTVSTGPTTVETFDSREVAARLGPALDYVLRVERFLLSRKEIYAVFTLDEPRG